MSPADGPDIRVLVVEDDEPTRVRLQSLVASSPGLELVGGCADRKQGIAWLLRERPDVVLVDLDLPDGSGLDVIRAIGAAQLATEAMVITVFDDESHVVAAIEAGATGYLLKDGTAEDIASAITDLVRGGSPISSAIARHILRKFRDSPVPSLGGSGDAAAARRAGEVSIGVAFTTRETEVLNLVAKGLSYVEIAAALGVSAHTATSHVKHIYRKLSVHSRGEAVFEAVQRGLIRIDYRP